jgi:hypothetical protein
MEDIFTSNDKRIDDDLILKAIKNSFLFLQNNYDKVELFHDIRDENYVAFSSSKLKQKITVLFSTYNTIEIHFRRPWKLFYGNNIKKTFVSISSYYEGNSAYNGCKDKIDNQNYLEVISKNAEFMQKYLMPVIKGEIWFNKLKIKSIKPNSPLNANLLSNKSL